LVDAAYWISRKVNEASPAYYFLKVSPWLFILGSIFWFAFWYWAFKKLKEQISLLLAILFIAGHSWGSTTWIFRIMRENGFYTSGNQISVMIAWGVAVLYFFLIALFASHSVKVYLKKTARETQLND